MADHIAPILAARVTRDRFARERDQAEQALRQLNQTLEKRVTERTAELVAANRELEAFSYSVSHDLRSPLRAIDGYARILDEDYEATLDSEGRRVLGVVRSESQRMGQLIDDLLAFSRTGRQQMQMGRVDMDDMVAGVCEELRRSMPQRQIELRVAPLPPAAGDPALLRQVWVNLLSNAFKFTGRRERAVVEVRGEGKADRVEYSVSDNGVGFDMRYADKLFGVFQRLHSRDEFDGTGVGLALVQRIVHRHGGEVRAEGRPGEGAVFTFTLPIVKEDVT